MTAVEALQVIVPLIFGTLAGLVGNVLVDMVRKFPGLAQLNDPLTNLLAAVVSLASGWAVAWGMEYAQVLDSTGTWVVIGLAWPAAKAWFEIVKNRKAKAA